MKKLIIVLMMAIMCGAVSANLLVNSSFEDTFTDEYSQTVDATIAGSFAYGGLGWQNFLPRWNSDENWGFALNPTGSGTDGPFGQSPPDASDGAIIYGAGHVAHYFGIFENANTESGISADGTKTYVLTFDFYHDSRFAGNWLTAKIQMPPSGVEIVLGGVGVDPGVPLDSWQPITLSLPADMAFDGAEPQVYLQGSGGSWVDNVSLVAIPEPAVLGFLGLLAIAFLRGKLKNGLME